MDDVTYDSSERQTRKRTGSLRKSVLLGVERLRGERRSSLSSSVNNRKSPTKTPPVVKPSSQSKTFTFELPNSSSESHVSFPDLDNEQRHTSSTSESASVTADEQAESSIEANTHDVISPTSTNPLTLSDDEVLSFSATANGISSLNRGEGLLPPPITSVSASPSPPSSESSDPAALSALGPDGLPRRRRSTLRARSITSPLTSPPVGTLPPIEEEWDYSDTEWWGWIILIVTWIVFVVGMGSCLGVWSWAWDVGSTPYAPPELEDDPTLPIVGYYPALLVLTAVMSWVWVVTAWVGLKFFRHAKMGVVEDG